MQKKNCDHQFKIVLVGDSNVGKTDTLFRFVDDSLGSKLPIGMDFKSRTLEFSGKKCKLRVYDTTGQEKFKHMFSAMYRDTHAFIIVFDVTNRASFDNVSQHLSDLKQIDTKAKIVLFANNIHLINQRTVTSDEIKVFASREGLNFFEVSATTGENVEKAFTQLAEQLMLLAPVTDQSLAEMLRANEAFQALKIRAGLAPASKNSSTKESSSSEKRSAIQTLIHNINATLDDEDSDVQEKLAELRDLISMDNTDIVRNTGTGAYSVLKGITNGAESTSHKHLDALRQAIKGLCEQYDVEFDISPKCDT